jgi:hypothetical protein
MKFNKQLLLSFSLLITITSKSLFNNQNNSYQKIIRTLWEEDMEYDSTGRDDNDDIRSLKHCSYSSYKYFSFIQTGAPVTFNHSINEGNVVSIIN